MTPPDIEADKIPTTSPFVRLLAFEVYDGPIVGLLERAGNGHFLLFRLLAWDADQVERVFSLAPVEADAAREVIEGLSLLDVPRWPEWWLDTGDSPDRDAKAEVLIEGAWKHARPSSEVVVTKGLLGGVTGARPIVTRKERLLFDEFARRAAPNGLLTATPFESWRAFVHGS